MDTNTVASNPAQKQAWTSGGMPEVERVGDGLWSIPVPIPANPLRYVLVYALELPDGVAIVDSGWNTDEAWGALTQGLKTAGASISDVRSVLITHVHPDHYGLAGRVREESGAWVGLHPADAALLEARYDEVSGLVDATRGYMLRSGVPPEEAEPLAAASLEVRQFVSQGKPDRLLEDGQRLDLPGWDLRVVWTPGHSPGHVCFVDPTRRILFSGDHVLPRITPNISIHSQQPDNPLADFLDSLAKVRDLDVDEVMAAHEYRFRGLATRVDELTHHHEQRLAEVTRVVTASPESTCWQITQALTWSRPWEENKGFMRRAALGETLAHLVLLELRGQIRRVSDNPIRWVVA